MLRSGLLLSDSRLCQLESTMSETRAELNALRHSLATQFGPPFGGEAELGVAGFSKRR